jgi:hypothetical protein
VSDEGNYGECVGDASCSAVGSWVSSLDVVDSTATARLMIDTTTRDKSTMSVIHQ